MTPKQLKKLANQLNQQEWIQALFESGNVFVVGGSVRDAFLQFPIKDVDLIVEGISLEDIKEILSYFGKVDIVGESFSVIKFSPKEYTGEPFDIAVPRIDKKTGKGHKGFKIITDGVSIEEDLKRRDFTINSIAFDLLNKEIVDPFNGVKDIIDETIKATDLNAFIEDPLRIIRGIQFASRFNFKIEPNTLKLMREHSYLIKEISGERIFEELQKIITKQGSTQVALNLLNKTGVDKALFDKEMILYDELDNLDGLSFYYVLGLLGDVNPAEFVKRRLKGDNKIEKGVRTLDYIFTQLPKIKGDEEELRLMLFKAFKNSREVMDAIVLPPEVDDIVLEMRLKKIPMIEEDIVIGGDDIKNIGNIEEGPEIGKIKNRILRDALMNKFNWKDRNASINYLSNILF